MNLVSLENELMIYHSVFSHCFIINYLMIELCLISDKEDSAKQAGNIFFFEGKGNFYFLS